MALKGRQKILLRDGGIPMPFSFRANHVFPFNRPAGQGYFPHDSRHFVPGYTLGKKNRAITMSTSAA
jgi:hypothetical protein